MFIVTWVCLPLDMNTWAGGCERRRSQSTRKCRNCTRKCTCAVGTSVSNRNRSRNHIRVGIQKTANRRNPAGRSTPARRWPLRTWCSDRKDWGSIVPLHGVWKCTEIHNISGYITMSVVLLKLWAKLFFTRFPKILTISYIQFDGQVHSYDNSFHFTKLYNSGRMTIERVFTMDT